MNAPGGIARPPRREDYEPIVRGLKPLCDGEELMLRTSLLLMRDRAIATKATACEASYVLLELVERETSIAALHHSIDIPSLTEFRRLCIQCVLAASSFDTLYQADLPLTKGEAHGRG